MGRKGYLSGIFGKRIEQVLMTHPLGESARKDDLKVSNLKNDASIRVYNLLNKRHLFRRYTKLRYRINEVNTNHSNLM